MRRGGVPTPPRFASGRSAARSAAHARRSASPHKMAAVISPCCPGSLRSPAGGAGQRGRTPGAACALARRGTRPARRALPASAGRSAAPGGAKRRFPWATDPESRYARFAVQIVMLEAPAHSCIPEISGPGATRASAGPSHYVAPRPARPRRSNAAFKPSTRRSAVAAPGAGTEPRAGCSTGVARAGGPECEIGLHERGILPNRKLPRPAVHAVHRIFTLQYEGS